MRIPIHVDVCNHPMELMRHFRITAGCDISQLDMNVPLPEIRTLDDVRNEFEFFLRKANSLTKKT